MRNTSLAMAAMMALANSTVTNGRMPSPLIDHPTEKTKTGYPTDADFARLDKAQAKRDKRAERNLRNAK